MSDPPARILVLDKRKVGQKMTTLNRNEIVDLLIEKGICVTDNICVFCSLQMDGWDSICRRCREYKGVMNIVKAIEHYDLEIIGY